MKQALHIFHKDIRHYWPELATSLALVVGFARHEIYSWRIGEGAIDIGSWFISSEFLSSLTVVLLPVAWMLLIVRAIHDEPLVGDRQFWVTRPYEWNKLLVAKLLFVFVSINVPMLVLDCFLLHRAGFAVIPHIAGLLWMQLLISLFLFLPIATLAAVTATLAQVGLAILLVLLYLIAGSYIHGLIPSSSFSFWTDSVQGVLYLVTCIFVILLQFGRRRTARSRAAIFSLGAVVLLFLVFTPYRTLVARAYPQLGPGRQPPVQLALLPPPEDTRFRHSRRDAKDVTIQLPLSVSGIRDDSFVVVNGETAEVSDNRGARWDSAWISHGGLLFPGQKQTEVYFPLKRDLFEHFKSQPVNIKVSLAVTVYDQGKGRDLVIPSGWFALPEVGLCSAQPPMFLRRVHCLAPLRRPSSLLVSADLSATTCQPLGQEAPPPQGEKGYGWIEGHADGPAEFGISPIKLVELSLGHWNRTYTPSQPPPVTGICPGTPVRLSTPVPTGRMTIELILKDVRLADYQLAQPGDGFGFLWVR